MLTNLAKLAAEKARDAAEEYFKLQNIDMAIKTLKAAKDFNQNLPNIEEYFTAYKVHALAAKKSTWYELLDITDPEVDTSVIRKQYKRLALMLHPDKNPSVAADGAFKIIGSALEVLKNPEKRKDYDSRLRSKKAKTSDPSCSRPPNTADDQKVSRDESRNQRATNASSGFRTRADSTRKFCTCSKSYGARVEISVRNGSRKIIITRSGVDEDVIYFRAKDSRFDFFFCSFFFGDHHPTVIQCS